MLPHSDYSWYRFLTRARWTTGKVSTGTFRVVLKHQPRSKSATSTVDDGASDVNISWDVTVE